MTTAACEPNAQAIWAVWQEESFDHVLRSEESFEEKLEYIRQNPVRRGLVGKPEDYRWLWLEKR